MCNGVNTFYFPKGFLWGAATSSYQVEGMNLYSDWWEWERQGRVKYLSGEACRHYWSFEEDFDLAKSLGHNAHRLSIEWSRIEPKRDKWDEAELRHYCEVIRALRKRNLEPIVTLHHFTNPKWLSEEGGWLKGRTVRYFCRYVERIVETIGKDVQYWITINEPMVFVYYSYIKGIWPPGEKSIFKAIRVMRNLISAHKKAYKKIHKIYQKYNWMEPGVSIAKNIRIFQPCLFNHPYVNRFCASLRDLFFNRLMLEELVKTRTLDFIGLNYYTREFVRFRGICKDGHHKIERLNSLGWEVYPEGLLKVLLETSKKYKLPIMITENGTCQEDDPQRWQFILDHLVNLKQAMERGVEVMGYLYWSLLDNFEWDEGFFPRFGLIEVDYRTFKRKTRESALAFASVCKNNRLEYEPR